MANIIQLYKFSKKADCGWISVLAHKLEDLDELKAEGWVRSIAEIEEPKPKRGSKANVNSTDNSKQRPKASKPKLKHSGS